jgi:methylated-DNA-[protein]-cysteine S-methyltransferase
MNTAYYKTPFGWLRLRASDDAVTEINFVSESGPSDEHPVLQLCREQLDEYFMGARRHFDFPMHQDGTEFQQRVWNELVQVPFGRTISYMQLSKRIGDPKAVRAVGLANGRNNLAIVVPCHRVIGSNSSLTGYAGGLAAKQWLLAHEARFAGGVQTLF